MVIDLAFWIALAAVSGAFVVVAVSAWGVGRSVLEEVEGG